MLLASSLPVGGRLRLYWRQWQSIGASNQVVRWLRDGYQLPFRLSNRGLPITPPLRRCPPSNLVTSYSDPAKQAQLDKMLHELLEKRAIREVPLSTPVHFSRVFLVPKKNGKMRLVIDLSSLNQWLDCPTFQLDHVQVIRESLSPGMWATSIDLSDAYLHIPIHPVFWQYLVFQVGNKRYQFMVLPFGLNTAPRVFSAVMKALKKWARRHGILLFQYLDDWLLLHLLTAVLNEHTLALTKQCTRLGLLVNFDKSETTPTQSIVFLGDHLDFASGFIFPTQERFLAICDKIALVTRSERVPFKTVHSLLGLLAATEKIVPFGRIHYRMLLRFCSFHISNKIKRWTPVHVHSAVLNDLLWWIDPLNVMKGLSMTRRQPDLQVQTDASTTGWGISVRGQIVSGHWSLTEQRSHINVLEMKTVLIAFQRLMHLFQNRAILFLIDNQTVVSYLQKQGGTKSLELLELTAQILNLAESNNVHVLAQHIKGSMNVVADLASRVGCVVNTEWSLSAERFQWVQQQSPWGPAVIDLFANRLNHQLSLYFSPCPDDQAMSVDALMTQWPQHYTIYAFPPTTILDRVLHKIIQSRPQQLLLVAPRLLEAPWYPLLQQLPCRLMIPIPLQMGDLRQPHWDHHHHNPALFQLHLWAIAFPP